MGDPLKRLADIDLPAPPHWQPVLAGLAAAAVLIPAFGWLAWRAWRRRGGPRTGPSAPRRAAARIDAARRCWEDGEIDDREASYRLACALRLGLGMDQLEGRCPPALAAHRTQWNTTVAALARLRYEPAPAARLRAEDFARIKDWLERAGRTAHPGQAGSP